MRIGGVGQGNSPVGAAMMQNGTDAVSKDIQRQIEETKKQIQELSEKQNMTLEEKMKKRQELQKQLTELTNQLRQHQIEQRRQKQQEKKQGKSMDELLGGSREGAKAKDKTGTSKSGMSQAGMKALISADSAMKQADVQGSVATSLEGRAGVLEAEIHQDGARGIDVSSKKEELAEVEQRASDALASQGEALREAGQEVQNAADAEQTEKSADTKKTEEDKESESRTAVGEKENKDAVEEELLGNSVDIRL